MENVTDSPDKSELKIGEGKPGPGRPPGMPNKLTRDARTVLAAFMDDSAPAARVLWLRVAVGNKKKGIKPDPARALDILAKLGEYVMPKLARTEVLVPPGGQAPISNTTLVITDDEAMKSYLKMVKGASP